LFVLGLASPAALVDKPMNLIVAGLWSQAWDLSWLPSRVWCGWHCGVSCWPSQESILLWLVRRVNRESSSVILLIVQYSYSPYHVYCPLLKLICMFSFKQICDTLTWN
jgi:hypothetical protein